MTAPVMIMAGGTGGHVFPALAVAGVLRDRGRTVVWLGTRRGIESRLVPGAGYPIEWIEVDGLRGKGAARWLSAPFLLLRAVWQARAALRRRSPGVVLGCGGFVSGPGGLAAWLRGTPLVIHEQNAVAGITNRWLARFATRVAEAFPGSFQGRSGALLLGNPVRPEIAALPPPAIRYGGRAGPLRVFVFGGSQGASALNRLLPQALSSLPDGHTLQVLHQTGEREQAATAAAYRNAGIAADIRPFVDDMAAAYGWADLIVSRSGALTVSELAAAGVAALLLPYPAAVDDHQARNAEFLVRAGAARLLREPGLTVAELGRALQGLLAGGRPALQAMAEAARARAVGDAAERLAVLCIEAGEGGA